MAPESGTNGISRFLLFNQGPWVASYTYFTGAVMQTEGIVLLEKNDYPESTGLSQLVWLAYASACVLDHAPTNRLKPVVTDISDPQRRNGFSAPAVIERVDSGHGVPRSVLWYFNRAEWESSLNARHAFTPSKAASGPLPVWDSFRASDFREVNGVSIPGKVVFKAYADDAGDLPHGPQAFECSLTLEELEDHAVPELFDTVFHGRATVEDRRLVKPASQFGVDYRITNAAPIPASSSALAFAQARQEFHERLAERNTHGRLKRVRTLVVIAAFVACVVFFFALAKQNTKRRKE
jgi:hypothetical protein